MSDIEKVGKTLNKLDELFLQYSKKELTGYQMLHQIKVNYAKSLTDPDEAAFAFKWIREQ